MVFGVRPRVMAVGWRAAGATTPQACRGPNGASCGKFGSARVTTVHTALSVTGHHAEHTESFLKWLILSSTLPRCDLRARDRLSRPLRREAG